VVSSTDAAAVFSVLRGSGIQLKRRVGATLEVESGINDPVAFLLTTTLTAHLLAPDEALGWGLAGRVVGEILVGAALGLVVGYGGRRILARVTLPSTGLYPVLTLALALLAFAVPTLLHGSGFLAVYVAGGGAGRRPAPVPRRDAARARRARLAQSDRDVPPPRAARVPVAARGGGVDGLALALFLAVVARPLVVALCCSPSATRRGTWPTWGGWGCAARCRSSSRPSRCSRARRGPSASSTWCSSSSS
jgi:cell volume regulation protein A